MKYLSNDSQTSIVIFKKPMSVMTPEGEEISYLKTITDDDVRMLTGNSYDELTEDEQFEVYIHFCVQS